MKAIVKEDSLKSSFELNDPRNPQCPCHKYQKLADEEYKRLLGKEIKPDTDNNRNGFNNSLTDKRAMNLKNKTNTKKFRSGKYIHPFFNFKKKKNLKRSKIRRLRKDNVRCFHF